jgi:heat shock protein HslJ
MKKVLFVLFTAASVLASIAEARQSNNLNTMPTTSTDSSDFSGKEWRLLGYGTEEAWTEVPENIKVTLRHDAEQQRVYGVAACNRYFGGMEILEGQALKVGMLGATRMMCAPELMEVELAFHELMRQVNAFAFDGEQLVLRVEGGALLRFLAE